MKSSLAVYEMTLINGKRLFNIVFLLMYFKPHIFQNLALCHLPLHLSYKMTNDIYSNAYFEDL